MASTISATISAVGRPALFDDGEPDAVALGQLVLGQAVLAQEAFQRLLRRVGARALQLFVRSAWAIGQALDHQGQAARPAKVFSASGSRPAAASRSRAIRSRSFARLRLHARGDFFGEQFDQQLGHLTYAASRLFDPGGGAEFTQVADAADVALAFGDGDGAAGVHQVEQVAGLQDLVVGGQDQRLALRAGHGQQVRRPRLHVLERRFRPVDVIAVEVGFRLLALVLEEDLAIGQGPPC
jgi:hypothetical protein